MASWTESQVLPLVTTAYATALPQIQLPTFSETRHKIQRSIGILLQNTQCLYTFETGFKNIPYFDMHKHAFYFPYKILCQCWWCVSVYILPVQIFSWYVVKVHLRFNDTCFCYLISHRGYWTLFDSWHAVVFSISQHLKNNTSKIWQFCNCILQACQTIKRCQHFKALKF